MNKQKTINLEEFKEQKKFAEFAEKEPIKSQLFSAQQAVDILKGG